jgi:uncharacterized repeat protein (TIGR03943 family)
MDLPRIARAGRVAATLAWSLFLVYAWMTGRLMLIHPSFRWLSLAAAAALGAVALALIFERRDHDEHHTDGQAHAEGCGCAHAGHAPSGKADIFFQCVVLMPILVSLWLGRGGLSTQAMVTRGVKLMPAAAPAASPETTPAATPPAPPSPDAAANPFAAMEESLPPMTLSEIHFALLMGRRDELDGRRVEVLGQHFVDDRCAPGEFCVVRILVTCCLADAEVMGLLVKPRKPFTPGPADAAVEAVDKLRLPNEPGAMELKMRLQEQGPWVEVTGKMKAVRDRRGQMIYCITEAEAKNAPPPAEILLYPKPMMGW